MKRKAFEFWYKGHQILAVPKTQKHVSFYHFYVGLSDYSTFNYPAFDSLRAEGVKHRVASIKEEPFVNQRAFSMYALDFKASKKKGLEMSKLICALAAKFEAPEREFKEFRFPQKRKDANE